MPRHEEHADAAAASAGRRAAARSEEGRQVSSELGHITQELANQLGGLVKTDLSAVTASKPSEPRHLAAQHASAIAISSSSRGEVANLVKAASAEGGNDSKARRSANSGGVVDHAGSQRHAAARRHRSVEARKAAEVMRLEEQRAATKAAKQQTAAAQAKAALLRMVKEAAVEPKPNGKKMEVAKSVGRAETLVKAKGKEVPMSSRHDPAYVDAEEKRDAQAEAYLNKLVAAKEAQSKAAGKPAHLVPALRRQQDRTALAEKYLKVMEKQALDKRVPAAKAQDRNVEAEKYLEELHKKKAEVSKAAPEGSRHNARYVDAEHARDEQAALDMALLKKDQALVKKGGHVEKVQLSKAVVRGEDRLKEERRAPTRKPSHRTQEAHKDMHALKPLLHKFIKTHLGKFFHTDKVPKSVLKSTKLHLSRADKDLKQLKQLEKHPHTNRAQGDRNVEALVDLKKLEAKTGRVPKTLVGAAAASRRIDADALAQEDLKSLPAKGGAPVLNAADAAAKPTGGDR